MNNIYINIVFGLVVTVASLLPGVSEAYSYAYDPVTYGGGINIINDNYNNNINTNVSSTVAYSTGVSAEYIAKSNLPVHTTTRSNYNYSTPNYQSWHHGGGCGRCTSVVEIGGVEIPKPFCTLVPAITQSGDVELQWVIKRATVAYIDSGIGHIAPTSGSMIITPTKDTTYNLTVLNDAGIASSCLAKVNVTIDPTDPTDPTDPGDSTDPGDTSDGGSLFGDTFRAIALPIGVAFLILMILLIVIMSKVKNAH
jgi:hypothetical protein